MDSNDTKQIIIAYHAIENAIDAILKPIRIELGDSETVAKMPKDTYNTLEYIQTDCKSIQKVLSRMADDIGDFEESVYDDGEIAEAGKMINDILLDVPPVETPQPFKTTNAVKLAENIFLRTG